MQKVVPDYFDSFSTPFSTFWAPGPRGPRNSFSDSFSNFGPAQMTPVAGPGNHNIMTYFESEESAYNNCVTDSKLSGTQRLNRQGGHVIPDLVDFRRPCL